MDNPEKLAQQDTQDNWLVFNTNF